MLKTPPNQGTYYPPMCMLDGQWKYLIGVTEWHDHEHDAQEAHRLRVRVAELEARLAGTPLDIVDRHVAEERERCIDRALAWWAITPDLDAIPTDVAAEGIRAAIEGRHPDLDLNPQP